MAKPGSDLPSPISSEITYVFNSDREAGREYGHTHHHHRHQHHGKFHSKLHGGHRGREHGRGPNQRHLNQHHHSVGFWDRSMSKVRAHVIQMWLKTGEMGTLSIR